MLGLLNNWFGSSANPIGVDFGSDCLKLAQVQWTGSEHKLVAAASADVPPHVRHDPAARLSFFAQTTRDLLAQGKFRGRQAVLALPAASMFILHLRMARMDDDGIKKALPWEARGKLPIDPSHAILRHLVAGEIYQDQEPRSEVIVMAAARDLVKQLLDAAGRAKLDVIGMTVEPTATVHCFGHVYRRKTDEDVTNLFVDIGASGTRAVIARGQSILFARAIPVGGDHFARAVAGAMKIGLDEARLLRLRVAASRPQPTERREKQEVAAPAEAASGEFAILGAAMRAAERRGTAPAEAAPCPPQAAPTPKDDPDRQAQQVEEACREPLAKLVEELELCRRYYESTFSSRPVDRLIFVGGEARQRTLCQSIAQQLGLAAQVGDPLVRMSRTSEVGIESGIDRRQPQPAWTVAIGLSMGPVLAAVKAKS